MLLNPFTSESSYSKVILSRLFPPEFGECVMLEMKLFFNSMVRTGPDGPPVLGLVKFTTAEVNRSCVLRAWKSRGDAESTSLTIWIGLCLRLPTAWPDPGSKGVSTPKLND